MNKVKSDVSSLGVPFISVCISVVLSNMLCARILGWGSTDTLITSVEEILLLAVIYSIVAFWLVLKDTEEVASDIWWDAVVEFVMEHQQDEEDRQLEETKEELLKEETEQEQGKGLVDKPIVL